MPHTALTEGTPVGHYQILDKIGAGGMGEVYLARDATLNRKVALKFLPTHLAQDPEVRARFTREAQAAAGLDHPNIVTVHEVGEFQGRPYFAMQYVKGQTLRHVARREPLPLGKIPGLAAQIADGLARAHEAGLIHRDIKSANIILDTDQRPRILDFGLAAVPGGEMLTQVGTTLGTAAYMSPEQARGRQVDHRSDLFSLGVVLYELIAGRLPFEDENINVVLNRIATEEPEPLARYKTGVPADLQRIVTRCMAKDPAERYQSAADLAADLRMAGRAMASGGAATSEKDVSPSIAVLPFTNMSADPENEYFADGLTEELLNVLAKNAELKVTGRTSSFAFKGKQEDLRGIGKKLGVATLLEGSVRKAGNRVRITAQLVNAEDGFHLWTETYDRVLEDIFAVQDEIAGAVGEALNVTLLGAGKGAAKGAARPAAQKTVNPEAYDLMLRAKQSSLQLTRHSLAMAEDLYRKALDLDPENAPAWAGLCGALARQAAFGYADHEPTFREAKQCAERALALDDTLPEAHRMLGWVLTAYDHAFREAGDLFRKAVALAPNSNEALESLAVYEAMFKHFDKALPLIERAVELDPLNPEVHQDHARILSWAGRHAESETILRRALAISPGMTMAHGILSFELLLQGRGDEALAEARKLEEGGYRDCVLAIVYHALGRTRESDEALASLIPKGEHWAVQIAIVHAERGERDEAFRWLERAAELGDAGLAYSRVHPLYRGLYEDPRWERFLEKIGLGG
jgi:serine/threonine-protein kinase